VTRARPTCPALALALTLAGCAAAPRFADRAVLWSDPDDRPVALPHPRPDPGTGVMWPGTRDTVFLPASRGLTVDYGKEAVNVNAVDEVPDSTWYHDPRRDPNDPAAPPRPIPPAIMERGNVVEDPPQPPLRIVKAKEGGSAQGFVVDDARGRRYVLKLDPEQHPGLVTSADVVASRIVWASGWKVPASEIFDFTPNDLELLPTATERDRFGRKHRLEQGDVDYILRHAGRAPNGRIRAVASRWIAGDILGNFRWFGRDRSDGNDRFDHENRRDLRGFGVVSAWIDNIDTMENNTLDSYVGEPGAGHVVHYQQDVGGSFGNFASLPQQYWMGDEGYFEPGKILGSTITLGIFPRRWEDAGWQRTRHILIHAYPEFGGIDGEHFDPRGWRTIVPNPAFVRMTRRDRYWGAKLVAAFTAVELRAAIAAGHYRPIAADYLFDTLWRRREKIARAYFSETAALDYFAVDGGRLCFWDLLVRSGLDAGAAQYRAREHGRIVGIGRGAGDGRVCLDLPSGDGYHVLELSARRSGKHRFGPHAQVHLIGAGDRARVVGVIH
jgi:hypothetical protein